MRYMYCKSHLLYGYFEEFVHFWCAFCGENTICLMKNDRVFHAFYFY
jgi:predicted RNA-binding Zn-ribbon protein involved in translation (DUF1610 family)